MEAWKEELYHHGIKGQRWGIRRYQNPDGTLTPRGQKRYAKLSKELGELGNDNEPYKPSTTVTAEGKTERYRTETPQYGRDDYKYLDTKELRARNERLLVEETYRQYYDKLHPKKKSLGKRFVENILLPAAKDATKEATKAIISASLNPVVEAVKGNIEKRVAGAKKSKEKTTTTSKTDKKGNKKTVSTEKTEEGSKTVVTKENADGSSSIKTKEKKK